MKKIWLVMRHDAGVVLGQPSFWFVAILLPVLLVGLQAMLAVQDGRMSAGGQAGGATGTEQGATPAEMAAFGLVDPAGLLSRMPPGFGELTFTRMDDEASARAALQAGLVAQVVVIPADYLATGQVEVYDREFQVLSRGSGMAFSSDTDWVLDYLIGYNLTGDAALMGALRNPTPGRLAETFVLGPALASSREERALFDLVTRVVPYIFYFLLVMGASYLARSVVAEKENRTAEVLLLSLDPRQLMAGKVLAMSSIVLLQVAVWVTGGVLALNQGADVLRVARFQFPPGFVAWALLFLVLGYLLFASIMAAAGAIATSAREANQTLWLVILPLMPTLMFGPMLIENPDSPLVLFLSLFPLSSPSAMVTRLAVQDVPLWQTLLSLALLAAATYAVVALAARFFRSGNLLSGESFNWRRYLAGWRGQQ